MALDEEVVEVEESVVVADKQHTPQPGSSPPLSASDAASGLISAGRAVATWAGGNGWSSSTEEADECTLSSAQVAAVRAALAGTPPGCDYADTSLGSVLQNSSGA
jgi:hypothetical protein